MFLGGRRPLPLFLIEILGLSILALLIFVPRSFRPLRQIPLFLLLLLPILQLIPLPFSWWKELSGHAFYAELMEASQLNLAFLPISLVPSSSLSSLVMILVFVAVILAVMAQPYHKLKHWAYLALGVATFEAVLGLMQYGAGPMSLLRFGPSFGGTSAAGTYTNRDHLAGLLEMMLPLAIALLLASFKSDRYQNLLGGWQKKLAALKFNAAFLWIGVAIILMLGIIFTQSRTGIFLMLLGILLSFLVFSGHLGFKKIVNFGLVAFGVALLSAIQVGLIPVLSRFFLEDPLADLRWPMAQATIEGMPYFFPWGSGVGTFGEVFQRFQTVALNGFYIDHAHNDVLEFAFEGGLLAMAVMASFFFYYLRRWRQFWPKGRWERYHFIQAGAGISIFLMMLHSLVDFNLHVPANVVYFALVVGFFFHQGPESHATP